MDNFELQRMQQNPSGPTTGKRIAAYDQLCELLIRETERCRRAVNELTETVEYPKPASSCNKEVEPQIVTIETVLAKTVEDLRRCSDDIFSLKERLEERIGQLKILP